MTKKKQNTESFLEARGKIMLCALCVLLYILLLFLFTACMQNGQDGLDEPEFEEGVPTEVRITLSARSGNATRADVGDGTPKDPSSSVELIHNWWLVFINKGSKEVTIIKDTDNNVYDQVTSTTTVENPKGGYEAQTFRIILSSGKYRIYAFANIAPPEEKEDFVKLLNKNYKLEGKYINDFVADAFTKNINRENDGMQWLSTENIPMTKAMDEKIISNTVEEAFNIEVIRAVAKVEFAFSNPSTDKISLKELKFGPIIDSNEISISPNDKYLGVGANTEDLPNKSVGTLSFLNMNETLDPIGGSYDMEFYCKESLGGWFDKDGNVLKRIEDNKDLIVLEDVFRIDLTVIRTKSGETSGTSQAKTFYTKDIKYINRNDWIRIPIKFNNWVIKWKLHTYPPIGGYPPVFNQSGSGETLTATMTTGGEFELYPETITQNGDPYTVDWTKGVTFTYTDPRNLFLVAPSLKENADNQVTPINSHKVIAGELDPKKEGTATIRINFYLIDKDNKTLAEEKTCLFTIHRQNSVP